MKLSLRAHTLLFDDTNSAQTSGVSNNIVDRLVFHQRSSHQFHLHTVHVLIVGPADALFEVLQLSDQIPITHARRARRIHCFYPLPFVTVASAASDVDLRALRHIAHYCAGRGLIRKGPDVGNNIVDGQSVGTVTEPPFRLTYNVGFENRVHTLRFVATIEGGETVEARRRTASFTVDDSLEIELRQLYVNVMADGRRVSDLERGDFRIFDVAVVSR